MPSCFAYSSKPSRFARPRACAYALTRWSTAKRGSVGPSPTVPASAPAVLMRSRTIAPAVWPSYVAALRARSSFIIAPSARTEAGPGTAGATSATSPVNTVLVVPS